MELYDVHTTETSLIATKLIVPGEVINVNYQNGLLSRYYVKDQSTIYNIDTGQDERLFNLTNKRIRVTRALPYQMASLVESGKIARELARESIRKNRLVINSKGRNDIENKSFQEEALRVAANIDTSVKDEYKTKMNVRKRRMGMIDIETPVIKNGIKASKSRRVITAGLGYVEETRTKLDSNIKGSKGLIYSEKSAYLQEIISSHYVKQWSNIDQKAMTSNFWSAVGSSSDDIIYGRQNFVSAIDAFSARAEQKLRAEIENTNISHLERGMAARKLERLQAQGSLVDEFLTKGKTVLTNEEFIQKTITKYEYAQPEMKEMLRYRKGFDFQRAKIAVGKPDREKGRRVIKGHLGQVISNVDSNITGDPTIGKAKTTFILSDDPLYTAALERSMSSDSIGSYGTMETDTYKYEIMDSQNIVSKNVKEIRRIKARNHAITKTLIPYNQSLSQIGTDNKEVESLERELRFNKDSIKEQIKVARSERTRAVVMRQFVNKVQDIKAMTQTILKETLPAIAQADKVSRPAVRDVLIQMGLKEEIANKAVAQFDLDLRNPFLKGYSQETLRSIMYGQSLTGAHLAGWDSVHGASAAMKSFDTLDPSLKRYNKYNSLGPREQLKTVDPNRVITGGSYELSAEYVREMHVQQAADAYIQNANKKALTKILTRNAKIKGPSSYRSHIASIATEQFLDMSMRQAGIPGSRSNNKNIVTVGSHSIDVLETVKRSIRSRLLADDRMYVRKAGGNDRLYNFKRSIKTFGTKSPGLINELISTRNIASVAAISLTTQLLNWLKPGENIDQGKHASVETIARRMVLGDQGSPFGILRNTFKLAVKSISSVGNMMRASNKGTGVWIKDAAKRLTEGGREHFHEILHNKSLSSIIPMERSATVRAYKKVLTSESEGLHLAMSSGPSRNALNKAVSKYENIAVRLSENSRQEFENLLSKKGNTFSLNKTINRANKASTPLSLKHKYYNVGDIRVPRLNQQEQVNLMHFGHQFDGIYQKLTPLNKLVREGKSVASIDANIKKTKAFRLSASLSENIPVQNNIRKLDRLKKWTSWKVEATSTKVPVSSSPPILKMKPNSTVNVQSTGKDLQYTFGTKSKTYKDSYIGLNSSPINLSTNPKVYRSKSLRINKAIGMEHISKSQKVQPGIALYPRGLESSSMHNLNFNRTNISIGPGKGVDNIIAAAPMNTKPIPGVIPNIPKVSYPVVVDTASDTVSTFHNKAFEFSISRGRPSMWPDDNKKLINITLQGAHSMG